jgi:hypothetical protein
MLWLNSYSFCFTLHFCFVIERTGL